MHCLKLYQILIGNKASFLQPYTGEGLEGSYNQASMFWDKLDAASIFFVLIFFIVGIGMAAYYYGPFNNQPNRHYLPKYWWIFLAVSAIVSFGLTCVAATLAASSSLNGTWTIILRIALENAFLSIVVFFFTSVIWCKWGKTNAYRMFL